MESTLAYKRADLMSRVGFFLGYGLGAAKGDAAWSARQTTILAEAVNSGVSITYRPPACPPDPVPHDWSFLKPVATLTIPATTQHVTLPDDFAGFEGQVTILQPASTSTLAWWPVDLVSIGMIHAKYSALPQASGRPTLVALSPNKGTTAQEGSRTDLWLYPTTDQEYVVQFQYYLQGNALTDQNPYYYGGAQHGELFLEACLLMAESRLDDVPLPNCVHYPTFMARLAAAIHADNRNKPQTLGYNDDRSDWRGRRGGREMSFPGVTFQGVQY